MRFKVGKLLIFILIITVSTLRAQDQEESIQQLIESILENVGEDHDYSEITERLNFYRVHPLDINKATTRQLSELIFLNPFQANSIVTHIHDNGSLEDLLELQSIEGLDDETIKRLLLFVSVKAPNALSEINKIKPSLANHDLLVRYGRLLQMQEGFKIPDSSDRSKYLGSANRLFVRYRLNYGENIAVNLNLEKDAGEQIFSEQVKGFDFYSGSISMKNAGKFSKIIIGDYSLQFGQGLSLWSGLSFGKGASVTTLAKQDAGLKSYTSVNEVSFLRGVATTIQFKNLSITPFVSYQNLDASLTKVDSVADHDEIWLFGSNIQYHAQNLKLGFNTYKAHFNHPFEAGKYMYNQFEFAGKSLTNLSAYYSYGYKNSYFFGEAAHSLRSGYALINGVVSSLSPKLSILLLYRNYAKNYHSLYYQSVSEGSNAINEKGFYSGITYKPIKSIELSAYADVFKFPWLKYGVDAPSNGYDLLSQLTYTPTKKTKAAFRIRYKQKQENDDLINTANYLETLSKYSYRLELIYKINKAFTLRNRIEGTDYQKENKKSELGFMMYQDVIYDPMQSNFSGNIRFAIFNTQGFNSRIYAFENDLLYSYSVTAYQNSGTRFYVNGRYTLKRGVDFWCKYSITNYADQESIGTGLDQIKGHLKSDIRLQLRYQF
jgi:hypothetical protein